MAGIKKLLAANADAIDAIVEEFNSQLEKMVTDARTMVSASLRTRLTIRNEKVARTADNKRILRSVDNMLMTEMERNGFSQLLRRFTDSFNGQFVHFQEVLDHISEELLFPLPEVKFTASDIVEFDAFKVNSRTSIREAVSSAAAAARKQALFDVGGLPPKELAASLSEKFGVSLAQAETLADTAVSSFYRTITDKGYQIIEEDLPGFILRYNYEGPLDKITRPFCVKLEKLSRSGRTWTRKEIDKLNNGQIKNVFISGGGYNCRHQWVISIADMRAQQAAKGKPVPPTERRRPTMEATAREVQARKVLHSSQIKELLDVKLPLDQIASIRSQFLNDLARRRSANA